MKMKRIARMKEALSAVGFGCWAIGGDWNNTTDQASIEAVQRAVDLGVNFFDVAPVYGFGHAEEILGKALKGRRNKVLIASKCGLVWDQHRNIRNDLTAKNVRREIDDSLRRLQTEYIDLYQLHWPDPQTPIAETMEALNAIKEAGKIRYIGVSNFSVNLTRQSMEVGTVVSHQGLYNLLERNAESYHRIPLIYRAEREILPFCQKQGMAFLPYSPLFQGLLTGTFQASGNFDDADMRANNPKLTGDGFQVYFEMTEHLKRFAREIGKPLVQIAINWLIRQEAVTSVLCGAQNRQHVEENVASIKWELTEEMVRRIEEILTPYHV